MPTRWRHAGADALVRPHDVRTENMNKIEIQKKLGNIRKLRFFCHMPFLLIFGIGLTKVGLNLFQPDAAKAIFDNSVLLFFVKLIFVWLFAGFFVGILIRRQKCPRCGDYFHSRKNGSYFFYNDLARKCLNCGLKLDGSNVDEQF